jgi:hypothetical protein
VPGHDGEVGEVGGTEGEFLGGWFGGARDADR